MPSPDGEQKLAPVTFLFAPRGEQEEEQATAPSGEHTAAPARLERVLPAPRERESSVRFVALHEDEEPAEAEQSGASTTGRFSPTAQEAADVRAEKRAERTAKRESTKRDSRADGEFEPINNVSLHALGRRGISVAEMTDLLLRRGFDADAVSTECDRLLGVGLLDDALLAEALVRTFRERKGLGRSAVSAELKRRKIDPLVIEQTLSEIDSDDDSGRALELALKRAPQLRNLDYATAQRRLTAFLMRKGYSSSAVSGAVSTALSGNQSRSGGPVFR